MATDNKNDNSSIINQIIVAVVIALLVGGTSPWWWTEIFTGKNENGTTEPTTELPKEIPNNEEMSDNTDSKIWKQGKLSIPFNNFGSGEVADLDNGKLLMLGTSISATGSDISIRQSVHSIVLEPGLSRGDGTTFDARFIAVSDSPLGREECSASLVSPTASNHLQLSSDIDVGSNICMVTSDGRLAEFSISKLNLTDNPRSVEIEYVVWRRE
jgi:hypothetical protein